MNDKLSDWISNELQRRGWSQREVARRGGISHSTVSDVLSGQRTPTADFCIAIANAFGTSRADVLTRAGILPDVESHNVRQLTHLFDQLSTEDQTAILIMVRALAREKGTDGENE